MRSRDARHTQTLRAPPFTADTWPPRTNPASSHKPVLGAPQTPLIGQEAALLLLLLFTGARFPPGIQNRMLSEISIQGCLQFDLAIKAESVLAARWNIFLEGWKIKKEGFWSRGSPDAIRTSTTHLGSFFC